MSNFQLIWTFFRQCAPQLKLFSYYVFFFLSFQQTTHKPLKIEKYEGYYYKKKHLWNKKKANYLGLSIAFQHKQCFLELNSCTAGSYNNFKVDMNFEFLYLYIYKYWRAFKIDEVALANCHSLRDISTLYFFLIFFRFKIFKSAITLEMFIAQYLMISHFLKTFWRAFKWFFLCAR